jgi:hypothetical protein
VVLWNQFKQSFLDTYSDIMEKQQAISELGKLQMKTGGLTQYTANVTANVLGQQ